MNSEMNLFPSLETGDVDFLRVAKYKNKIRNRCYKVEAGLLVDG